MEIGETLRKQLLIYQRNEITEYYIYTRLVEYEKSPKNKEILQKIANDELRHYNKWKEYTLQDVKPVRGKVWVYFWINRFFGITFGVKLMEQGEKGAQENYKQLLETIPEAAAIMHDENAHEMALIELLDEERLQYIGSIVLGLNDALVELTGALAGLTLALRWWE